ncbi:MAG: hypothetical protein OXG30_06845 [bacterium]|nr:hypothetical protein [bacterium]MCY3889606.1 hypothetical protein [bacterium]MCY4134617.1 hypothetical protein [bacterium]
MEHDGETITDSQDVVDLAGQVRGITVSGLPNGYDYKATRYADVILKEAFPNRFRDLTNALEQFEPTLDELRSGGGGRTVFVRRFDESLAEQQEDGNTVWGKQNITIQKGLGFEGIELAYQVRDGLDDAEELKANWRELQYSSWSEAKPDYEELRDEALALMPPVSGN